MDVDPNITQQYISARNSATIQIMRGIAIILVLLHHAISRVDGGIVLLEVDEIIICIHMPVFFIISGYLYESKVKKYKEEGNGRFILNKAKHLLIPYAFWTILLWGGVQIVCSLGDSIKSMMIAMGYAPMGIKDLLWGLFTYETYYTQHLWFLYVLFAYFVIHTFIGEYGSSKILIPIGIIMGIINRFLSMPYIASKFMDWFVFFVVGRVIFKNSNLMNFIKVKSRRFWILISAAFLFSSSFLLLLLQSNLLINIYIYGSLLTLIKYLIGFDGILLLYILTQFIQDKLQKIGEYLKTIGDYSLDIYLMHNPYIVAFLCTIMNGILKVNAVITIIFAVVMGIIIPIFVSKNIIRRSKLLSTVMIGL